MATRNIVPRADSEGSLGTTTKRWLSAFIDAITTDWVNGVKLRTRTVVALDDEDATLTAAQLVGSGIFTITPTEARALTTDTAANIIAALTGYSVGSWLDFTIIALDAFAVTLGAGVGVTIVGSGVANDSSATFKLRVDSASAITIYRI